MATHRRHHGHAHHDPGHEHHHEGEVPIYDRGLQFDVGTVLNRRRVLGLFAGAVALPVIASAQPSRAAGAAASSLLAACDDIPEETAGPFPGDGSNGPNVLDDTGIVRSDIRRSFGESSGVARGVGMTMQLRLLDTATGCKPMRGAAIYVWQCDREGRYSMYSPGAEDQNYLRGVQRTDREGRVTFRSVFPACYPGRWPHVHFEVYPSLKEATTFENKIATSQLALPEKVCRKVYAVAGYEGSTAQLDRVSLDTDSVFRDGYAQQMAKTRGDVRKGYTAKLTLAV